MTPDGTTTPVITADGTLLLATDYGPAHAPHTLMLLHGLCLDQNSWQAPITLLRRRFADQLRIVTYDQRGHGRSSRAPARTYHVEQLADDLADVLSSLNVTGPLTVAGHSMGGMAALTYCARAPHQRPVQPHGLALIATAAGRLAERGLGRLLSTPAAAALSLLAARTSTAAIETVLHTLAGPVCGLLSWCGHCAGPERQALCAMCGAAVTGRVLSAATGFLPHLRNYDQYPVLSHITARTTVVSGGTDLVTPEIHARDLAAAIPGATVRHQATAGHMLLHEAPHLVADAIADIVTTIGGPVQEADARALLTPSLTATLPCHQEAAS
ncbi:alpha/beta fold hydrolase [Mycobacterium avium]|uniref:alpha/beta fold hydrolase n=1 Tax=Mycobacterium avium TaxID=1764 RepID=UPI000BB08A13|nr:alpha/beta hydrolase [Mycobacterium avium]PBA42243.1 alpha/beta hydrolase [Mycobacterium avium]PBA86046.1 alpha/beta hydrolase [Mycobacterium avium]